LTLAQTAGSFRVCIIEQVNVNLKATHQHHQRQKGIFRTIKSSVHDLCSLLSDFEFTLSTLLALRDKSVKNGVLASRPSPTILVAVLAGWVKHVGKKRSLFL